MQKKTERERGLGREGGETKGRKLTNQSKKTFKIINKNKIKIQRKQQIQFKMKIRWGK